MAGLIGHLVISGPDWGYQIDTKYPIFESTSLDHDIQKHSEATRLPPYSISEALKKE
jgi:hypothetical protein